MSTEPEEPEPDGLAVRTAQLAAMIPVMRALADDIENLAESSGVQFVSLTRRAQVNRRLIWALVVLCALGACVTAVLGFVAYQGVQNEHRTSALTQRLDTAQTVTRRDTLCPLYELFRAQNTKAARDASKDKAAYDHSFAVIDQGYAALGCAAFATVSPSAVPVP